MDVQVTCPRCHERQPLADPAGYTCVRCGARWTFVRCDSCDSRFHMQPGVTTWTCPTCGAHHVPVRVGVPRPAPSAARGPWLVGVAAVVVLVVAVWAIFLRNSGGTPTPARTGSGSSTTLQKLCTEIPLGSFTIRAAAVGREETAVRQDAKALKDAGATAQAKEATTLADALATLRQALVAHADTTDATLKVQRALGALPC